MKEPNYKKILDALTLFDHVSEGDYAVWGDRDIEDEEKFEITNKFNKLKDVPNFPDDIDHEPIHDRHDPVLELNGEHYLKPPMEIYQAWRFYTADGNTNSDVFDVEFYREYEEDDVDGEWKEDTYELW